MNKFAYELGRKTADWKTSLMGQLGKSQKPLHSGIAGGLGAVASGAATPYVNKEDWESSNLPGKAGLVFQNALLGGAGTLTGHDRFGAAGALAGLGGTAGLSRLISKLKPEGDEVSDYLGRAGLEGVKTSLGGSMLMSSLMRGAGLRNMAPVIDKFLKEVPEMEYQIGRPGSFISKMTRELSGAEPKDPGLIAKWYDLVAGSPNVAKAVEQFGAIPNIPGGRYLKDQLMDIGGGSIAGAGLLPVTALGGYLGHKGKTQQRADELESLKESDPKAYMMEKMKDLFSPKPVRD